MNTSSTLTKREKEIIKLLALGRRTTQIADRLFISEHTVNTHRRNILRKLDQSNTTGAVAVAFTTGIISQSAHPAQLEYAGLLEA